MSLRDHMRKFAAHSEMIDVHGDNLLNNPHHDGDPAAGADGHTHLLYDAVSASLRQAQFDLHALSHAHRHGAAHPHHKADGNDAHGSETADEQ